MPLCSALVETRASEVAGLGVFARRAIAAGEAVMQCIGVELDADQVVDGMRAMQIGPTRWLAEDTTDPDASDYVNHSCAPNLGFSRGDLVLYALCDIAPGDELSWDYSTAQAEPGWSVPCRSATALCRGHITGWFDLEPSVRERPTPLASYWSR